MKSFYKIKDILAFGGVRNQGSVPQRSGIHLSLIAIFRKCAGRIPVAV
jgi:hypothetical protein